MRLLLRALAVALVLSAIAGNDHCFGNAVRLSARSRSRSRAPSGDDASSLNPTKGPEFPTMPSLPDIAAVQPLAVESPKELLNEIKASASVPISKADGVQSDIATPVKLPGYDPWAGAKEAAAAVEKSTLKEGSDALSSGLPKAPAKLSDEAVPQLDPSKLSPLQQEALLFSYNAGSRAHSTVGAAAVAAISLVFAIAMARLL